MTKPGLARIRHTGASRCPAKQATTNQRVIGFRRLHRSPAIHEVEGLVAIQDVNAGLELGVPALQLQRVSPAASMVAGFLDRLSERTDVLEEPAEGNGAYPVG